MTKIVPVYSRIKTGGTPQEMMEAREVLIYDVYVDGRWVGSRRQAKDAEMLALQRNPTTVDAARMVG